jgi:hypothetical protein
LPKSGNRLEIVRLEAPAQRLPVYLIGQIGVGATKLTFAIARPILTTA